MSEPVTFCAEKFHEHFQMIGMFVIRYSEKLLKSGVDVDDMLTQVSGFEQLWDDVANSDEDDQSDAQYLLENHPRLLEQTLLFERYVGKMFKEAGIPCIPSLLTHMQKKLIYFRDCILPEVLGDRFAGESESWSYAREFAWWAQERAESLEFVNCELPHMANLGEALSSDLGLWMTIIAENTKLARKFREISQKASDGILLGYYDDPEGGDTRRDALEYRVEGIPTDLYYEMMTTMSKCIENNHKLLDHVEQLPLSDEDKQIVIDLLHHDDDEGHFAFERLQNGYQQQQLSYVQDQEEEEDIQDDDDDTAASSAQAEQYYQDQYDDLLNTIQDQAMNTSYLK
jgi:hypothetical protein